MKYNLKYFPQTRLLQWPFQVTKNGDRPIFNWLQIGAGLLQIGADLLQIGAANTNWDNYYKSVHNSHIIRAEKSKFLNLANI